ncbi:MAG: DinB family protein [Chloroflexi bacterium]|nr:DinB family protein [Chloroflexota bacterium]MDA1148023.1 DinB family protein [Chloroflexota bacterium]
MAIPVAVFFQQNAWATERLIEVCAQLTDHQLDAPGNGDAYGSIRDTLVHLLSAEHHYLRRLRQPTPIERATEGAFDSFEALKRIARANGASLAAAATNSPPDLAFPGGPTDGFTDADATVFLVQAINHGAEHRTQILTALTGLGLKPPELQIDGWAWGEENGALRPTPA